ncbi:MAG: ABC transporter permease [Cryobacterium sp.]
MPTLSPSELWAFARARHTWLIPSALILLLAVVFPLVYLSATTSPQDDLHDLPIALVTDPPAASEPTTLAEQLTSAIVAAIDPAKISLTIMTSAELESAMAQDRVAGAIIVPANLDTSIEALLRGPDATTRLPEVKIVTNAADGGISGGLVSGNLAPMLAAVRTAMGQELIAGATETAAASGLELDAARSLLLASPFQVTDTSYRELPDHSGFGTSAFYYALALVLLGFVGASVINPSIDSALGFAPAEMGPLVARRVYRPTTRMQTLLVKWGLLTALSPVAAALVLGVVTAIGVPIPDPWQLWLFGTAAMMAVGLGALSVFAIFGGGIGALVNTTFFIALAMTSSGGTVPISATPPFFAWLSSISPFHAVIEGTRALLYLDGNPTAGLIDGWVHIGWGALISIALGLAVTWLYARQRMFMRHPRPAGAPSN